MRFNPVPLIAILLLCTYVSSAQVVSSQRQDENRYRLSLKSGSFIPSANISDTAIEAMNKKAFRPGGKSFIVIQFERIPTEAEKQLLKLDGIELLDYIPNNAYTATVSGSLNQPALKRVRTRAVVELTPEQKMQPTLAAGLFPHWAVKTPGTIDVWISFPKSFSFEAVSNEFRIRNFDIVTTDFKQFNMMGLRIATERIRELASLPFIQYVQIAPKEDQYLNDKSVTNSRANILNSSVPAGKNLKGEGITIGIGDNSNPMLHADFNGRVINKSSITTLDYHGIHVMGTAGGAGNVRETFAGYAPKSKLIKQVGNNIIKYASTYVQDYGMVITNNSYGAITDDCTTFGIYDLLSATLDQQAFQMPNLQHVFSAGNSGNFTCTPYLAGFSNVLGAYQSAKNTITVGYTDASGVIQPFSSKGPVRDGRIKPEITAHGLNVFSAVPTNAYGFSSGTSMAAPGVSGGLALLYQRYKQLNGNINPKNGLMKALLCNGAIDKGNAGPDFSYGFGWMNLLRSVIMLENQNYFNTSVNNNATNTHTITIPVGSTINELKVMLYWNDSAAAPLAASALVNDLDLEVTDPAAVVHFPQLLNATPSNVNDPAVTGADHINNIEQVVIANPAPGNYTFSIKGTTIPSGTQHEYFLVFDTIPVSTRLTYPVGEEHLQSGDVITIQWDSYGNPGNDFTIQYSIDNGANWINIVTNVASNLRQYLWTIPALAATDQAKVKIIHNGTGIESVSEAFTVVGIPSFILSGTQCEGYIAMSWPAVTGATDYEIMMLQGEEMVSMATTTALNYTISGLSTDSVYWVSVRSRVNGKPGRRAPARSRQPNNGTCNGAISNNDIKVDAILSPASGRMFTSTQLSNTTSISIRIENLDNAATTGNIPVTYIIGNNPPVNETIIAPNIAARATYNYTFTTTADMSAIGIYSLKVSVSYPGDPVVKNDTLNVLVKQLDNPFIDLTTNFIDNIEAGSLQSHTTPQVGLQGLDRYDFTATTTFGQIRTFVNTGMAYSGSKALTLDADRFNAGGTTDSLTATFNLLGYNTGLDNIRLDFMYKHHGQLSNPANKVWIRGDDQKPWIEVYDLYTNQDDPGLFKRSPSLELSNILAGAIPAQGFSSSFQVRWGQWGQILAADNETAAGYTFDDIRLYKVFNDLQMISIDTPVIASCGLNNAVPVRATVRNSSTSAIVNIPVKLQIDNGTIITETIASIAANASFQYAFTATADLAAAGNHIVKVWVDLPSDTYRDNDTTTAVIYNAPLITTFPYLQNFEANNGSWHTAGKKSSWQYGTPASLKINRAASGSKVWKTRLAGNYNDLEKSYLYSPCFDITGMTNPTLSLNIALDLEDCGATLCDGAYIEYSSDGVAWNRLGTNGAGTNWYNKNYTGNHLWSIQDYTRWHCATIPLPTAISRLRLRIVMESDPFVSREGIAVDDIHIYDNVNGIYEGPPYTSAVVNQASVTGTGWIDFMSSGKLLASINPNGQNLGSTNVQAFVNTAAVRNNSIQYYHDRNITIKPANISLTDSATVRFYFLDTETETLIAATGCGTCSKPTMVTELGVTKFSGSDALENGTLADNTGGNWSFIIPANIRKVPFDKGYYAEFKVKDFSEFWLNNGGINNNQALPAELISFTATKNANGYVLTEWITASENNVNRYEIELARGTDEYNQNKFVKIGEVGSHGNSASEQQYRFIDEEANKTGVRYYRLKIVDLDGRFIYSEIRPVVFNDEIRWQVYPNPSTGMFNLVYQAAAGENVVVKIHDANGKLVGQQRLFANAFVQKSVIDMSGPQFPSGMYLLEVIAGEKKQVFRLLKK
jgi:hypothetical protein